MTSAPAKSTKILPAQAIRRALSRIAHEIAEQNEETHALGILGVQKGGVDLAQRLARDLGAIWNHPVPQGTLDVGMHRDDLHRKATPEILPTVIPFDVNGKTVVLVDDVLYSGRTARAALDAIHDFGRPRRVQFVVLIDRGNRELPIKADFVGKYVETTPDQRVDVRLAQNEGEDAVYLLTP